MEQKLAKRTEYEFISVDSHAILSSSFSIYGPNLVITNISLFPLPAIGVRTYEHMPKRNLADLYSIKSYLFAN